ncbi:MAG: hypothetical protein L7T26_00930 [Pseudomonadales bacterium]|nr:hypothetical protein [Pseudomonadales bacterium]
MSDSTLVDFQSWQAPDLTVAKAEVLDEKAIAAIKQSAYEEGFAQGQQDGEAAGLALTKDRADEFLALLAGIDQPLVQMDEHLAREVAQLAALVGAELARSAITSDPENLFHHVQRISEALPSIQHPPKIFLNPEDRALVAAHIETLPPEHPAKDWPLHDEASLDRGDCRLQGRDSHLSADLTHLAKEMVKRALSDAPNE